MIELDCYSMVCVAWARIESVWNDAVWATGGGLQVDVANADQR